MPASTSVRQLALWPIRLAAPDPKGVSAFRSAWLAAPMRVAPGFDPEASRQLWAALLPTPEDVSRPRRRTAHRPGAMLSPSPAAAARGVRRALAAGADPSARLVAPHAHVMPLSAAAALALPGVVDVLLDAGAARHWPRTEIAAPAGAPDAAYEGLLPDPMAEACRSWAQALASDDPEKDLSTFERMARAMGSPDLAARPDPATGRTPLQEVVFYLDGETPSAHRVQAWKALSRALWDWWHPLVPPAQAQALADGVLSFAEGLGAGDLPEVMEGFIQNLAREHVLNCAMGRECSAGRSPRTRL